ncbi:hypothetical protein ACFTAO_13650 [Paenibacillus rhizoplanae]
MKSSMLQAAIPQVSAAGGRYDAIIGKLVGRDDIEYPTVGISFGMESIMALLDERPADTADRSGVLIIPVGGYLPQALVAAAALRAAGIRTGVDTGTRKLKNTGRSRSQGHPVCHYGWGERGR